MHQRIGSAALYFNVRGDLGTQVNREGSARADVIVAQSPLNVVCSGWAVYLFDTGVDAPARVQINLIPVSEVPPCIYRTGACQGLTHHRDRVIQRHTCQLMMRSCACLRLALFVSLTRTVQVPGAWSGQDDPLVNNPGGDGGAVVGAPEAHVRDQLGDRF